jgi:hypothetical protein
LYGSGRLRTDFCTFKGKLGEVMMCVNRVAEDRGALIRSLGLRNRKECNSFTLRIFPTYCWNIEESHGVDPFSAKQTSLFCCSMYFKMSENKDLC